MRDESTGKTVIFTLDPENPPEMIAAERDYLLNLRDEDIDLSDAPSQVGKPGWRPGHFGPEVADVRRAALRQGLLLLDDDVIELFRTVGQSAPQKMNEILREHASEFLRKSA